MNLVASRHKISSLHHIEIQPESNVPDNEKSNITDNENTLGKNFIVELTNRLHSIYPSVSMNRDHSI